MKKIALIVVAALMLFAVMPSFCLAAEETATSFYIKKNGNKRPVLPTEEKNIEALGAIYIDPQKEDDGEDKVLYLTFDAGYENGNVAKVLDALRDEKVCGAFFLLGHIIRKNTDLVKRMRAEGHLVCNHTVDHKDMTKCSKEQMKENLLRLERIYEECTGDKMEKIFRFPEGKYDEASLAYAGELGYKTFFWSLAYADWDNERQPNPERAKQILLDNTHNGAIILLHPTSATNAEILPELIKEWRAMGYRFGNLCDLI